MSSGRDEDQKLVDRLSRQSEEALGRVAEELAGNPVVAGALSRAFSAREKALQAQEAAMGALGIPSAADIERLTRRLRSVSQRLEGVEDALDRVEARLDAVASATSQVENGAGPRVDTRLDEIERDLAALREALIPSAELPPRSQERLTVGQSAGARPSRTGVRVRAASS